MNEPRPVVGGSHDPLLEWALRESGSGLGYLAEGSAAGLQRFVDGELVAAAIHLHALDADSDENIAIMESVPALKHAMLVGFARREQGILVAPGNPLRINGIADLVRTDVRVAVRPAGAGAQLLLESELMRGGLDIAHVAIVDPPCPTGPNIAQFIGSGRADCGIATRGVAKAAGLGFVPLRWERFDLVVWQRDLLSEPLQALFAFLMTPVFMQHARAVGGYLRR